MTRSCQKNELLLTYNILKTQSEVVYTHLMDEIDVLLTRGVDTIYPSKEALEKVLRSGKKLKLYQGFDPTGTQLHLGHMVGLRKLRQWQDLRHHVIFLIGDDTATIGDPTGKDRTRPRLTKEQVLNNAKTYKEQASKIVRFDGKNPVEIKYNSEWLDKLGAHNFMHLTSLVSYNQIIERDMFQRRLQRNESIGVLEMIYPILQGYDSVAMDVDLELGGSDQMFNMMMGRELMQKMKNKNKFVMTTPLLTDAQGNKVGKTEGNVIALTDKPEDLFGKIMALPDDVIVKGLEYLTNVPTNEIKTIEEKIKQGENPMIFKKQLAYEIVKQLNDEEIAQRAKDSFERTVQKDEIPTEIPEYEYTGHGDKTISDFLVESGLVLSKSEAKRLIEQGGVTLDSEMIENPSMAFSPENNQIIKIGKRKFVKIKTSA